MKTNNRQLSYYEKGEPMNIPRFDLGQVYNEFFYKFVPCIVQKDDGGFVKYQELERLQAELDKCHAEIADKESIIAKYKKVI